MTRDEARKAAAVMLAYADGKDIQCKTKCGQWALTTSALGFDWTSFDYRVKPEVVRYRRVLWRNKSGAHHIVLIRDESEMHNWVGDSTFVRFIDTEWQEVEV